MMENALTFYDLARFGETTPKSNVVTSTLKRAISKKTTKTT